MKEEKKLELDSLNLRENAKIPELDLSRFQEDPSHMELEECCGNCCWFYGEDTYGFGCCPYQFAEVKNCGDRCQLPLKYVSKKEMRHHMAVLLLIKRWYAAPGGASCRIPSEEDMIRALDFAYRYMKIFSEL